MNQLNDKGELQGYWEDHVGNIWYKGYYNNGEPYGYWEWYDPNDNIIEKQFFL
jgi:antitoxin component YwqK of YwqJK toxin-antitoxin module